MSGIFGFLQVGNDPALARRLAAMDQSMAHWGPDGGSVWLDGHCALGHRLLYNTPEALYERLPRWVPEARLVITAEARIDNRDELCDQFAIPHVERPTTPDSDLILRAYLKWGEASPDHLLGDWSFAIWHPVEQKLFLARDHHGNTSLCYWLQGEQFAFASTAQALYAIGAARRLNERYLAQVLICWPAYHGSQTIDLDIQRLPPAHAMTVTPKGLRVWRYWRLEDTPELQLPGRDDYLHGFLDVYDTAVRCRLRSYRPVGVALSGGLDSGSVTALAARALAKQGQRLTAFTAVPLYDTSRTNGPRCFGDETEYAAATAAFCGNVDHILLDSEQMSPMAGIYHTLAIMPEPAHAAGNYFWITDLLEQSRSRGLGTLLTGQGGNATVSWTGAPAWRSRLSAFRHGGWRVGLRRNLPLSILRPLLRWHTRGQDWSDAAIHPNFARRLALSAQLRAAMGRHITLPESWCNPRDLRHAILQPGATLGGALWAQWGAASGLEVRDPTLDKRVMAYTLAVPDPMFDTEDGLNRWLIRQAMAGLLPEAVRLNRRRGLQSADLAKRLRSTAHEVDAALAAVDSPPANGYLEIAKMRQFWAEVQQDTDAFNIRLSGVILLRGLLAGLFLNRAK